MYYQFPKKFFFEVETRDDLDLIIIENYYRYEELIEKEIDEEYIEEVINDKEIKSTL